MAKTRRIMASNMKLVDAVVEITDARIPYSSTNPEIKKIVGAKPRLVLLNKADSADAAMTDRWIDHYKKQGVRAIATDCRSGKNVGRFYTELKAILKDDIAKWEAKGMTGRPIRIMIVGIPNVGKSSFINRLAGSKMAKVEDRPGVTKGKQWVSLDEGFELLDMPGVLWPRISTKRSAVCLQACGSIKDEVTEVTETAYDLMKILIDLYPKLLEARYGVPLDIEAGDEDMGYGDPYYDLFLAMGKKRGCVMSGGRVDEERFAKTLLTDLREGRIGRITLEDPDPPKGN
jgi:ribosome biogenesis GTPase A